MKRISQELNTFNKLCRSRKDSYLVYLGESNDFLSKRLFQEILKTASTPGEASFYKSAYSFNKDMKTLTIDYLETVSYTHLTLPTKRIV